MDFSAFSLDSCQASVATLVCRELGTTPDLGVGTEPARMPCGSWCLKVWIVVGMGSLLLTVFPGGWGITSSWGAVNFNGYFEIFISYIYALICHCKSEGLILGYSFTEVIFSTNSCSQLPRWLLGKESSASEVDAGLIPE